MATARRLEVIDLLAFVLIVAGAAGARVWYLNAAADSANGDGPLRVQDPPAPVRLDGDATARGRNPATELDVLAGNLKESNQFIARPPFASKSEETAHVAPGYPYFLSLLDRLSSDGDKGDQLARWVQAGLGALTAGFYYLIALMVFRSRLVGLLAGLFCILHPFWIVSTSAIEDGTLATFLLGLVLVLGTRAGVSGGALTSLLYGLALAGLALVRAALLPFAIVGLLWFLLRCRQVSRGWLCALLAFLGFVNGLVPWGLRNWRLFQEPVPIVDSRYFHFWMGNNPQATGGPMTEKAMADALVRGPEDQEGLAQKERLLSPSTTEQKRHHILGEALHRELRENPAGTVRRRIWAGLCFVFGEQFLKRPESWVDADLMVSAGKYEPIPDWLGDKLPLIFYAVTLGMLLMGFLGWRWTYAWRHEARLLALATIFIPLPYILSHAEALVGPRLPLDGVLLTYAAFALACVIPAGGGMRLFRGPEAVEEAEAVIRRLNEERPHVRF